jgi:hypothetical protein
VASSGQENGVPPKKKICFRKEDRQFFFQHRAATPPPDNPTSIEDKMAVVRFRASSLVHSDGWATWKGNGSAVQYRKAVEATTPKKIWLKRHVREQRELRRRRRIREQEKNSLRRQAITRAFITAARADGRLATPVATPAAAAEFGHTPPAREVSEQDTPLTRSMVRSVGAPKKTFKLSEAVKRRISDCNLARELFPGSGSPTPPRGVSPITPPPDKRQRLEERVEIMRPILEKVDFAKTYSERNGNYSGYITPPPRPATPTPDRQRTPTPPNSPHSDPELVRLSPIVKPTPVLEAEKWRRRMKAAADRKMAISLEENRAKALKCIWKAENNLEMAAEYLLHITQQMRRQQILAVLKEVDAIKGAISDEILFEGGTDVEALE